jgi:hypothetical protein
VSCLHVLSLLASLLDVDVDAGEETLGRLRRLAKVLQHRSLGAIITMSIYRMAACGVGLPIAFLSNLSPTSSFASVSLEATGICSAWVLAWVNKTVAGYQRDEVYIGTAENALLRTTLTMTNSYMGPGHPRKLPGFTGERPQLCSDEVRCIRPGVPRFYAGNGEGTNIRSGRTQTKERDCRSVVGTA